MSVWRWVVSSYSRFPYVRDFYLFSQSPQCSCCQRWYSGLDAQPVMLLHPLVCLLLLPLLFLHSFAKFLGMPRNRNHKARNSISASSQILWGFTWCWWPPSCPGHGQGVWAVQQVRAVPAARTSPTTCHNSPWNANKQRAAALNAWMKAGRSLYVFRSSKEENICIGFLS